VDDQAQGRHAADPESSPLNPYGERYVQTVRLLLRVAPDVFANDIFAMKGGTAINLFVRDMPRLSVDIDVVYPDAFLPRPRSLGV
jgi:predicted nucleotidyltransferase component of viral defense system